MSATAAATTETNSRSESETATGKKRKIEEEEEEEEEEKTEDYKKEKGNNKKKKTDTFLKCHRYLKKIVVFHSVREVHDIIDSIIDGRIKCIVKELGISTALIKLFPVPRNELLEEVKRIVLNGVHVPLKILMNRMPQQVTQLIHLISNMDEDVSIMPEVCRLVENDIQKEKKDKEKKADSRRPVATVASFGKMIIRLQHIRYNIIKMIAEALKTTIPVHDLKKQVKVTICKEIYVSIVPFSAEFTRFFIDDEEGFYEDLDDILEDDS